MVLKVNSEIVLRSLQLSDAGNIFNTIDSERAYLGKWLPFVKNTKKVDDVINFIKFVINQPEENLEFAFTIRKQNKLVGLIHLKSTDIVNRKADVGYWLSEKFQKQGIMSKSLERICNFAFNELNLNRIQVKCAIENISSKNIPKKLGFIFEGIERGGELFSENTFLDLEVYSKLKSDN